MYPGSCYLSFRIVAVGIGLIYRIEACCHCSVPRTDLRGSWSACAALDPWFLVFWLGHGSGDRDLLARIVIPCLGGWVRLGSGGARAVPVPIHVRSSREDRSFGLVLWLC